MAQYYPLPPAQAYPREPVPAVSTEELPPINAPVVKERSLPPVGAEPAYQPPPTRYETGIAGYPEDAARVPPIGSRSYRNLQPAGPYDLRGPIPPGPPASTKQDAIREQAMRSQRLRNNPNQVGSAETNPSPTYRDPVGNMAALPPEVRPEAEAKEGIATPVPSHAR